MTCCNAIAAPSAELGARQAQREELRLAVRTRDDIHQLQLAVPAMHCGGCIASIEAALRALPGVETARANLTARAVTVQWRDAGFDPSSVPAALQAAGFDSFPLDDASAAREDAAITKDLLIRMAVAGFASANVMLLSVSVWAGASDATRDLLHWISALIALPAVIYSGQPFFSSALRGLRAGRLNMDAPISLAVILAAAVSLSEVMRGGEEAYFDAAVMLLFLLLIGRTLDRVMRGRARSAARALARMQPRGAWRLEPDGTRLYARMEDLRVGDRISVSAGERLPVDGTAETVATVDASLVTGESRPVRVRPGDALDSGVAVLDSALTVRATRVGDDTSLAAIARLCAAAEEKKSRLARLADRAAAIYAPLVHAIALLTLIGWMVTGAEFREAMMAAVAVLIVTCPCALGLAAPMAQAVACGTLFRRGVMIKDASALERLARVDHAIFDKTGVLTLGAPVPEQLDRLGPQSLARLAGLAQFSTHPLAVAITANLRERGIAPAPTTGLAETAGEGISGEAGGVPVRLGSAAFCGAEDAAGDSTASWFREGNAAPQRLDFATPLREGAAGTLTCLTASGIGSEILSGDREAPVAATARSLGVKAYRAGCRPEDKIAAVQARMDEGHAVLMVGDGINDAPALAAASVSMAPSGASDIGRTAADIVFTGQSLSAVTTTIRIARKMRAVILQNFGLAALYNAIAIPLAVSGLAGPLVAAIAMCSSSLLVSLNALRLHEGQQEGTPS